MSNFDFSFDGSDVEAAEEGILLPEGYFKVVVAKAFGHTNDKNTSMYKVTYKVVDDEKHNGKCAFGNHIVRHETNDGCVNRGKREMKALTMAGLNAVGFSDPEELVGATLVIKTKIEPASGGFDASTKPSAWFSEVEFSKKEGAKYVLGAFARQPDLDGAPTGKKGKAATTTVVVKRAAPAKEKAEPAWKKKKTLPASDEIDDDGEE